MNDAAAAPLGPDGEPEVRIMSDGSVADSWTLASLYDAARDEYRVPEPPAAYRETLLRLYLRDPGATPEKFDAAWPQVWKLTETVYRENDPLIALLDTGVMLEHPLLADCIGETVDFTGEGIADRAGHGTLAALLARMMMTGVPRKKLVIVKCVSGDGRGSQANFIKALQWLQTYNATHSTKIVSASMSLGAYNKIHFGLFDCDGTCALCQAAVAAAADIILEVAAGNTAGKTACPARAAFLPSHPRIRALARADEATSGTGTVTLAADVLAAPRFMTLARHRS